MIFLTHKDSIKHRHLFLEKYDESSTERLAEILFVSSSFPVLAILGFVDQDVEFIEHSMIDEAVDERDFLAEVRVDEENAGDCFDVQLGNRDLRLARAGQGSIIALLNHQDFFLLRLRVLENNLLVPVQSCLLLLKE